MPAVNLAQVVELRIEDDEIGPVVVLVLVVAFGHERGVLEAFQRLREAVRHVVNDATIGKVDDNEPGGHDSVLLARARRRA